MKWCINIMLVFCMTILAGCVMNYKDFKAVTIKQSGEFELDISSDQALPLFTAPGEKLWIPIWDPVILYGDGVEKGTVWVTTNHGSTTYWYVEKYDADKKSARYVRVTPDADIGTVDVLLSSLGNNKTKVSVTYTLTGLSDDGNKNVEKMLHRVAYDSMMVEWKNMVDQSREAIDDHFGR